MANISLTTQEMLALPPKRQAAYVLYLCLKDHNTSEAAGYLLEAFAESKLSDFPVLPVAFPPIDPGLLNPTASPDTADSMSKQ